MEIKEKGIVIWCGDAPNQRALACRIAAKFTVAGIVIDEHKTASGKGSLLQLPGKIIDRLRFHTIYSAWKKMMRSYDDSYPAWPDVPLLRVNNINDHQTAGFTNSLAPDLVMVSGTGLVKKELVGLPVPIGIINLHTGLSPYVKGGPNCTNWCIAKNEWHLVGNTIMWLSAGIDSGNIITTEPLDIRYAKDLTEAHIAVMNHAHDLYIRAIEYLLKETGKYSSVPQKEIDKGNLYLTKMWTGDRRSAMLRNWKKRNTVSVLQPVRTVSLPGNV